MGQLINKEIYTPHFKEHEANVSHFYLDGPGYVTIGIGCRVWDVSYASKLGMYHKEINKLASVDEITKEYHGVAALDPGRVEMFYAIRTNLYLPLNERMKLFEDRVQGFISEINAKVCQLEAFPINAQLVMLDMMFNLGIGNLTSKFTKFLFYFMNRNWLLAAKESHRLKIAESRNKWAATTLEALV